MLKHGEKKAYAVETLEYQDTKKGEQMLFSGCTKFTVNLHKITIYS